MSLTKIPFVFLVGVCMHVIFNAPKSDNMAVQKDLRRMGDNPVDLPLAAFIVRQAHWLHVAIELAVILAAAVPNLTVAKLVLAFLLPNKDPSQVFLSPVSALATALIIMGVGIRFRCYQEMGKHFTAQAAVAKDRKLIKTGPYSYVRHPAYTGVYLGFAGMVIWYTAQGSWLRESEIYKVPLAWLVLAPVIAMNLLTFITMSRRIPKEDEILKETFGKEWEEWARKVPARLCPGIY